MTLGPSFSSGSRRAACWRSRSASGSGCGVALEECDPLPKTLEYLLIPVSNPWRPLFALVETLALPPISDSGAPHFSVQGSLVPPISDSGAPHLSKWVALVSHIKWVSLAPPISVGLVSTWVSASRCPRPRWPSPFLLSQPRIRADRKALLTVLGSTLRCLATVCWRILTTRPSDSIAYRMPQ